MRYSDYLVKATNQFFTLRVLLEALVQGLVLVCEFFLELFKVLFSVPTVDSYGAVGLDGIDQERGSAVTLGLAKELGPNAV